MGWSLIVSFFSLRQMLFPKPNSVAQPSFGIGACAKPEAVTGSSVSTIFDLYSGVSQIFDALVNDRAFAIPSFALTVIKVGGKSLEKLD